MANIINSRYSLSVAGILLQVNGSETETREDFDYKADAREKA